MRAIAAFLVCVSAAAAALPPADSAVLSALKHADPSLADARVLHRKEVGDGLDLVLALGTYKEWPLEKSPWFWWGEKRKLGLFLQEQDDPGKVYSVAIAPGFEDCAARIERATETDVLISCEGEKSFRHPTQKFVYDVRAKALVRQFSYMPFAMAAVSVKGGIGRFTGSDGERTVVVEFEPDREPAFHIVSDRPGPAPVPAAPVVKRFGPDRRFALRTEPGAGPAFVSTLTEQRGSRTVRHELKNSSFATFASARPDRVRDGYDRGAAEMNEQIGPWKLEGDRLWFGKTFYDGEGQTGVGGFGYFDSVERKFRLFAPPEIAKWSVSSIEVDDDAVWLALIHNGEWGGSSGGLLRFDRRTETMKQFEVAEIVTDMSLVSGKLLAATRLGMAVVEGEQMRRFLVDRTTDGRLRIAEAIR